MRSIRYGPRLNSTRMKKRAGWIVTGSGIPLGYLLSGGKCYRTLIGLGYQSAPQRRDEILHFLDA